MVGIAKPFRRTCRPGTDGQYPSDTRVSYIADSRYADAPEQHVLAFELIKKDLLELFDYIEPAYENRKCYSYRIHELLMRTCVEVEANCKAIMSENGYSPPPKRNWNRDDYKKLEVTHKLSSYEVKFPRWEGAGGVKIPFAAWGPTGGALTWYDAYNDTKHDRHKNLEQANLENLTDAIAGLVAVLGAQFYTHGFSQVTLWADDIDEKKRSPFVLAIGDYFLIKFPTNWNPNDCYSFDWKKIENDPKPFGSLTF
jgi:hypothetical protein